MLIKRIIDKLRSKGYDDFYMANLTSKYDSMWFFFVGLLQVALVILPYSLIKRLLGIPESQGFDLLGIIVMFIALCTFVLFFVSWIPEAGLHTAKDKGESDMRISYMVKSWVCSFMLKVFRYAPLISMILLPIILAGGIIIYGFLWQMILTSAIGIVLLLVCSPFYHKMMNRISKEGVYYVDWKTNLDVEHFEETYSRHEKWWLSESEMEFEKFNIDHYRSIRLAAFIGTFGCLLAGLIFALSLSPLFGMDLDAPVKKEDKVEQITNAIQDNAAQKEVPVNSLETNAEPAENMDVTVWETTNADVVEDEDPIGEGDVIVIDSAEEATKEKKSTENTDKEDSNRMHVGEIVDKDGYANVRERPSINSKIVRTLQNSKSVRYQILTGSEWYKVYSLDDELYGYVHKSRVKPLYW